MAKDIIKNIPLTLNINASKRLDGTVDVRLYSKDIATGQFEFTFVDEDEDPVVLDETYSAQALVKYEGSSKTYLNDMIIEGNIIRFIFPHGFITKDGTVTMYIYVTKDNYTSDVAAISFPVFVSEIDKDLDPSIAVHYIGKIEQLIEDMKDEISSRQVDIDEFIAGYEESISRLQALETSYEPELNSLTKQLGQMGEKYNNIEQNYITRLSKNEQDIVSTNTQLTQKEQKVQQVEQEIVDARQGELSLGENLMALKDSLKTILELARKGNEDYVIQSGRYGARGEPYPDDLFVRYDEYFGRHGVNSTIHNRNTIDYNFDVIYYNQAQKFIKRDRAITNSKYVVDNEYLFRVAISRVDRASIAESDMSKIHNAFSIVNDTQLVEKSVKLENLADKQRITYPYPKNSLVIEQVKKEAVYFYVDRIIVRNHSNNNNVSFYYQDYIELLSEYVADSPSGGRNYIRIPEKKSLVYDVPEKTLKIVEWQEIETTQDLLLLSNHDDLKGVLADYWKLSILEDVSTKVESLTANIPKYWNAHINEKVNRIRSNQMSLGKDGFSFGFITDIHYNPRRTSYKVSSPYIMSKVMKDCSIKFFINGGDIGNQQNGENGREIIISDYYDLLGKFKDAGIIDKMMPLIGNHESNTQNWSSGSGDFDNVMVNNDEIYSIYFRDTERIHGISYGGDGTYYYVDDTPNQVRYVCLNTNDVEYTKSKKIDYAIKQQQFDWLISEALELPNADWSVILASHIPPVTQDFNDRGMPVKNMELLKGIVKAFKNKSTFSNSESHSNTSYNASVNVDFTSNENDFIVWISGHHHRDYVTLVDNSYTVVITPDDGRRNYDNPIKTIGTDTEHVMDFFTVDKINKKVLITRVGAGEDREFTY